MKPSNLTQEQVTALEKLGFKDYYPDEMDKGWCVYELNIEDNPVLNEVKILVDGQLIEVWAKEDPRGAEADQNVLLNAFPFTHDNLFKVIGYFIKS